MSRMLGVLWVFQPSIRAVATMIWRGDFSKDTVRNKVFDIVFHSYGLSVGSQSLP